MGISCNCIVTEVPMLCLANGNVLDRRVAPKMCCNARFLQRAQAATLLRQIYNGPKTPGPVRQHHHPAKRSSLKPIKESKAARYPHGVEHFIGMYKWLVFRPSRRFHSNKKAVVSSSSPLIKIKARKWDEMLTRWKRGLSTLHLYLV